MSTITAPSGEFAVVKKALNGSIIISVLMIVVGVLAIILPPVAGVAITLLVGWLMLFTGAAHLAYAWHTRTVGGLAWGILLGTVYILAGGYVLLNPVVGLASLTFVLAAYLVLESILELMLWYQFRLLPGSSWFLVDGIITLVLALVILRTWPASTVWVVGTLVGISMLFSGVARLMHSLGTRHLSTT